VIDLKAGRAINMADRTRITLMNRIVTLMIFFTIFFIGTFTAIQLNNQLRSITIHNVYRAKLGGIIVRNSLEKISYPEGEIGALVNSMQKEIDYLYESGMIENGQIISSEGMIIASSSRYLVGQKAYVKDKGVLKAFEKSKKDTNLFRSAIDKKQNLINQYIPVYIPLANQGETVFLAKISYSLGNISDALKQVYLPCILTAFMVIGGNLFFGFILSKAVIGPINVLNSATKEIAGGKLELQVEMQTGDEIEELADTFNDMTQALIKMKARAENANPLTKLPGNNVIHENIENRIKENKKFVVVYTDLDNFKAFNDKYGIGAGDKAIKLTSQIMAESLKKGNPDDFLGHEGGDDFVLLTTPDKAEAVTNHISSEFDKQIRALYSKEDLDKGLIVSKARDGSIQEFPIMTISLAGVTNEVSPLNSYAEVTNICAGVKKKAKKAVGSVFVLDERAQK